MATKASAPDGVVLRPIARPRAQVEDQLRTSITSGAFEPGGRLPSEAQLAEGFRVSRSTVREALQTLAAEGLINKVPGKGGGSFVNVIDHRQLGMTLKDTMGVILALGKLEYAEVGAVRRMLEEPAAALAAVNRSDEHLARLREILEREREIGVESADPLVELDAAFHTTIAEASGNRLLSSLITGLHGMTQPALYPISKDDAKQGWRQHAQIVKAIHGGSADAGRDAMHAHLAWLEQKRRTGAGAAA
jgi:DNA-binding FadR family transcriptional regulator